MTGRRNKIDRAVVPELVSAGSEWSRGKEGLALVVSRSVASPWTDEPGSGPTRFRRGLPTSTLASFSSIHRSPVPLQPCPAVYQVWCVSDLPIELWRATMSAGEARADKSSAS